MGTINSLFYPNKPKFTSQLKVDPTSHSPILGIYLNENYFPKSGLIIVTNNQISSYNPVLGSLNLTKKLKAKALFSSYNKKSREGSLICLVLEDMTLNFINTENFKFCRIINLLKNPNLKIKDNTLISCINFELKDAVLVGCEDGSIIKCKLDDEPINLLFENKENFNNSGEYFKEEFAEITNIFSNLSQEESQSFVVNEKFVRDEYLKNLEANNNIKNIDSNNLFNSNNNYIISQSPLENIIDLHISHKYKILFCVHKLISGYSSIRLFNLRINKFIGTFCKVKGIIRCSAINDISNILVIVTFNFDDKKSQLEIWKYSENACPISIYDFSNLINGYDYTISSIYLKTIPQIFLKNLQNLYNNYTNSNNNNIILTGNNFNSSLIALGTSKGDIIIGEISLSEYNNKLNFKHLSTYKLFKNNEKYKSNDLENEYDIIFICYDFNFDMVYIGDKSSNVKFIEKILLLGESRKIENKFPFFSFEESDKQKYIDTERKTLINIQKNGKELAKLRLEDRNIFRKNDLPFFSIKHDIIKDRDIILYNQGVNIEIKNMKINTKTNKEEYFDDS